MSDREDRKPWDEQEATSEWDAMSETDGLSQTTELQSIGTPLSEAEMVSASQWAPEPKLEPHRSSRWARLTLGVFVLLVAGSAFLVGRVTAPSKNASTPPSSLFRPITSAPTTVPLTAATTEPATTTTTTAPPPSSSTSAPSTPLPAQVPPGLQQAIQSYLMSQGYPPGSYQVSDVAISTADPTYADFAITPTKPNSQPALGIAQMMGSQWSVVAFGSAMVGCGTVPPPVLGSFAISCTPA